MKKLNLLIVAFLVINVAAAQNLSKNGHQITPETDDWGIGIDIDPFFDFFGNMFNGTTNNNTPSWNYVDNSPIPMTVSGFLLKDENTAYRGKIRLGVGSSRNTNFVTDDLDSTGIPPRTVEDERKISSNNILIGVGIQKMRGKHRIRGVYGAEFLFGLMNGKTTYGYGNAMTTVNQNPTSTSTSSWDDSSGPSSSSYSTRMTEMKLGTGIYVGVRGFIGAEYFVAPKLSIAGEFGWGIGFSSIGEGESVSEFVDNSSIMPVVISVTEKTGKSTFFGFDNDTGNPFSSGSGSLRLNFYF